MNEAIAVITLYLPPDLALIRAAREEGRASVDVIEPGRRVRMSVRDYRKPGDRFGIELNPVNHRLLGATVTTYLEKQTEPVSVTVKFSALHNSASDPVVFELDATPGLRRSSHGLRRPNR